MLRAAVFRLDGAVVVGEAETGFPGQVDIMGTADGVTGGVLELLVFFAGRRRRHTGCWWLSSWKALQSVQLTGSERRTAGSGGGGARPGRQIQPQVAIDGLGCEVVPLKSPSKAQSRPGTIGQAKRLLSLIS